MRSFVSKDGRQITPLYHEAIFKGKRNSCKGKTLIILNHFLIIDTYQPASYTNIQGSAMNI